MSSNFAETQLFGGAITALIPSNFANVSTLRQVPDNQEVYLDADGFASLTFDITERVAHLQTDQEALEYHFTDIVAEEDSREIVSCERNVNLPHFSPDTPILSLVANITPSERENSELFSPSHITIFTILIRLVEQATDIVISLNIPTTADSFEAHNESAFRDTVSKVIVSFEIKDWNLFNGD